MKRETGKLTWHLIGIRGKKEVFRKKVHDVSVHVPAAIFYLSSRRKPLQREVQVTFETVIKDTRNLAFCDEGVTFEKW